MKSEMDEVFAAWYARRFPESQRMINVGSGNQIKHREECFEIWQAARQQAVPSEELPFYVYSALSRYRRDLEKRTYPDDENAEHNLAWLKKETALIDKILAAETFAAAPQAEQAVEPVGRVLSADEMGIGYDRRQGNILWFGTPTPGSLIYTAPPAPDVSGLVAISRKILAKLYSETESVTALDAAELEDALATHRSNSHE